ncbi:MAG: hypothetical protein OXI96_08175 [Acidimicrobiaceae bacterium]|nr:hypothetical protein [Acidimicrobiaceae bacterium]
MSYYSPTNRICEIHDNPEDGFNDLMEHFEQTSSGTAFDDLAIDLVADLVDEFDEVLKDDHGSVDDSQESDSAGLSVDTSSVDLSEIEEIESDLEEILSHRLAGEDGPTDEDEDDHDQFQQIKETSSETTFQCRGEWLCRQCFLIVSKSQFGSPQSPVCPSSEYPCEGMEQMLC